MRRYIRSSLSAALLLAAAPVVAEEAFTIKVGSFNLTHDRQHLDGAERSIEEGGDNVYAFAWERRHFEGTAYGLEFIRFDHDWQGPGSARGEVNTNVLLITAKRYVQTATTMFPYLGMGAGVVQANVDGLGFDAGLGLALQLAGGVEFRWQAAGLYTEVKGLYAETGILGDEVNSSGIGIFVGATLRF